MQITCFSLSGAEIGCLKFEPEEQEKGATVFPEKIENWFGDSDALLEIVFPSGDLLSESCIPQRPLCEIVSCGI